MTRTPHPTRLATFIAVVCACVALVGLSACSGDEPSDSSSPDPSTAATASSTPGGSTPDGSTPDDSTVGSTVDTTIDTTPVTLAPEFPEEELPERLLVLFTDNFGDPVFAECVRDEVFAGLERGDIASVDIDNYLRNLITDPMQDLLLTIQNDATCSQPS